MLLFLKIIEAKLKSKQQAGRNICYKMWKIQSYYPLRVHVVWQGKQKYKWAKDRNSLYKRKYKRPTFGKKAQLHW